MSNFVVQKINEQNPTFCTLITDSFEAKKTLHNAITSPVDKVSSFINKRIVIKDIYMEVAHYENDEGTTEGVKTILITPEGEGIMANSQGVAQSIYQILTIFGLPSEWEEPLTVEVQQRETKNGRWFTLKVV